MYIEIGVPATLPLAVVKLQENGQERLCLLAATMAHPAVHLRVQEANSFTITGPRADVASAYAQHLYDLTAPELLTEIEIEHAIPMAMGLGSEPMLGLAIANAIKYYNAPAEINVATLAEQLGCENCPSSDSTDSASVVDASIGMNGLALWASQNGGLLLLDLENPLAPPLRHAEPDSTEKNAWGIVYMWPRLQDSEDNDEEDLERLEALEGKRFREILNAARMVDASSGEIFTERVWPAVEADDLEGFCRGLSELQMLTTSAVESTELSSLLNDSHRAVLQQMVKAGGMACSQSLTGYTLYGFARGARATINMRAHLRETEVGHFDGQMNATFIDSSGTQVTEKEGTMKPKANSLDRL